MSDNNASLETLTNLFNEFHTPTVSSSRRKEIQEFFVDFEQLPNASEFAFYSLWRTDNQYMANYCLGIIEVYVIQKWCMLSENDKMKVYIFIKTYMTERVENGVLFLIKKAAKIFAFIACQNWLNQCDEYINFIRTYLESRSKKCLISLFCMKAIFEQFANYMQFIDSTHKMELQKLLTNQSGIFCDLLITFITQICEVTFSEMVYSYLGNDLHIQLNSPEFWHSILSFISVLVSDCLNNCSQESYFIISYFDCLCEFLNFMLIDNVNFHKLMVVVFVFSLVGTPQCLSACVGAHETLVLSKGDCSDLKAICLAALTCVYDLIEKRELNDSYQIGILCRLVKCHMNLVTNQIVIDKYYGTFLNGSHLSKENNDDISSSLAIDAHKQTLCHEYELKLVYIVQSLFPCIMKVSYVNNNHGNMMDIFEFETLIQLFYTFTFSVSNLDVYIAALKSWSNFFESIQFYCSSGQSPLSCRIFEIVLDCGKFLLSRLFYNESSTFLTSIDDEDILDDCQNEFVFSDMSKSMSFSFIMDDNDALKKNSKSSHVEPCEFLILLRESLLVFQSLVDILSKESMKFVFDRFVQSRSDYLLLLKSSGLLTCGQFTIPKGLPAHRVYWILRDFATSMQVVGFLFEHMHHLDVPTIGRETLHILIDCLHTSASIFGFLAQIDEKLIYLSFVEVIVQNVLIIRAIFVSGCLGCSAKIGDDANLGKVCLTYDERDNFIAQLMTVIGQLVPSPLSVQTTNFKVVKYCVQLFKTLFTSPISDLRPPSGLVLKPDNNGQAFGSNIEDDKPTRIFQRMFNLIFEPLNTDVEQFQRDFDIKNSLISTFVVYLSWDEHLSSRQLNESNSRQLANTRQNAWLLGTKQSMLNRLISSLFIAKLNVALHQTNPNEHLIYLGFLNDAIGQLDASGNAARNLMHSILTNSGLIDQLVACLLHVLNADVDAEASNEQRQQAALLSKMRLKFCTAYLNFFVTFIRILSNSSTAMSSIPQLLGHIIRTLNSQSTTNTQCGLTVSILEYLMPMFSFISRNRRIFVSLIVDTLGLYIQTFLPILAYDDGRVSDTLSSSREILELVCLAGKYNGPLMHQFYELVFSILTNHFSTFFVGKTPRSTGPNGLALSLKSYELQHADVFHELVRLIVAVFDTNQVNSSLVQFVTEQLLNLNQCKRLFNVAQFSQPWLAQIICLCLNLLVDTKHESCKDVLAELIYQCVLVLSTVVSQPLQDGGNNDDNKNNKSGFHLFVHFYLPKYLNEIQHVATAKDCDELIDCFGVNSNLSNFTEFSRVLNDFVRTVHKYVLIHRHQQLHVELN